MLLIALAVAAAAPLLVLPSGEDPRAWSAPAQLAGLDLVAGDPRVEVRDLGTTWEIRVGDAPPVRVPVPVDIAGRERVAALARSLTRAGVPLSPVPAGSPPTTHAPAISTAGSAPSARPRIVASSPGRSTQLPPAPVPPTEPAFTPPVDTAGEPQGVVAGADAAEAPTEPNAPTSAPPVAPQPATAPALAAPVVAAELIEPSASDQSHAALVLRASGDVRGRPGATLAGGVRIGAGVQLGAWDLQVGGAWCSPQALDVVGDSASMGTLSLSAGPVWSGGGHLAPSAGVSGGVEVRRYTSAGAELDTLWTPFAAAQIGARLRVSGWLAMEGGVLGTVDLGKTLLQVGDAASVPLSPLEIGGTLGIRVAPR